jgi:hypothetical protein
VAYSESNIRTHVTVGPSGTEVDLGLADRWEGGDAGTDSEQYVTARGPVNLGGTPTRDDGTARWLATEAVWARFRELDNNRGRWKARVTRTPFADDGTPLAQGEHTMTGIVNGVTAPNTDYSSRTGGEITVIVGLDGPLA